MITVDSTLRTDVGPAAETIIADLLFAVLFAVVDHLFA